MAAIGSSHCTSYLPKRNNYIHSYEDLFMNAHSRLGHNQKLETTQNISSVGKCIKKLGTQYNGILLSNKKDKLLADATRAMNLEIIMLNKRRAAKKMYMVYESIYIQF